MRSLTALLVAVVAFGLSPLAHAGSKGKKAAAAKAAPAKKAGAPSVKLKPVEEPAESAQATSGPPATRGPTRIDFDDRLIQGQTNKSGAVYLYDRKELKTRSMIKKRESFRDEIVSSIYDS